MRIKALQTDPQQVGSIDLRCRLAAYWVDRVGSGQRCCWPLNADPLGCAMMRLRNAAVLFAALPMLGCLTPGSSIGHVSIKGSLETMSGARLPDQEIRFILPAAYGLGGLDLVLNEPSDFGHQDHAFSVTTDSAGEFSRDLGDHIYHVSCWLLPPVGCYPQHPPPPFLLVRVPAYSGEYYAVQTSDGEFKVFTSAGVELPLSEAHLAELHAKSESGNTDGKHWTVGVFDLRFTTP